MLREPLIEEVNELRAVLPRASSQEGSNSSFSGEDFPFSFSSLFSLRGLELMAALTGCHFGAFSLSCSASCDIVWGWKRSGATSSDARALVSLPIYSPLRLREWKLRVFLYITPSPKVKTLHFSPSVAGGLAEGGGGSMRMDALLSLAASGLGGVLLSSLFYRLRSSFLCALSCK